MKNICDVMHGGNQILRDLSCELTQLAYHFEAVGNWSVAKELRTIGAKVKLTGDSMCDAWGEDVASQCNAQWESTALTIKALCDLTQERKVQ